MNYPNNIKKHNQKLVTYDNRGMDLENLINKTNEHYLDINRALIYKKPTPIGIVEGNYKKITNAYFKAPSTLDYNGIYKGKYIEFEAKETKCKTSFPLKNIHDHQINHIRKVLEHNGICFIIISMNSLNYLLNGPDFLNYIDNKERKSIEYDYIKNTGYLLRETYNGLNYLDIIDNICKGELKWKIKKKKNRK